MPGRTRLLWVETPTNPTWDVIDIAAAAAAARAAGALLAVDCTAAPPCTTLPLALGADIAFHSGTKYLGGHSDLTAGVLSLARREGLWDELVRVRYLTGSVLGGFEAWLLIRGLRTLFVRYERASASALAIAERLERHPGVERVLYPGLPTHPGHAIARPTDDRRLRRHAVDRWWWAELAAARAVALGVRLFIPATSFGGVESLIEHRRRSRARIRRCRRTCCASRSASRIREDLIADLEQALERAGCGR